MATEHFARYLLATQFTKGRTVLDAACGSGYGTHAVAEAGAASVVGVDIAPEAFPPVGHPNVRFVAGDLRALPVGARRFDVVLCFEAIEHVDDNEAVVRELERVLADDGLLVVSTPNAAVDPGGNPFHVSELTSDELVELVSSRLPHVALLRQHAVVGSAITAADAIVPFDVEQLSAPVDGTEDFAVVVASRRDAHAARAVAVLGDTFDLRWWQDQLRAARAAAARAERDRDALVAAQQRAMTELDALREQLSLHGPATTAARPLPPPPVPRTISSVTPRTSAYHGRAGGLWYDRLDAEAVLAAAVARHRLDGDDAVLLQSLIDDGCVVLPGAVAAADADRLVAAVSEAIGAGDRRTLATVDGDRGSRPSPAAPWMAQDPTLKVLDAYMPLPVARDVLLAKPVRRLLRHIFDGEAPVLFQSVHYFHDPEPWFRRDTAYVKTVRPMELVGCWFVLDDVQPGSELAYVPGSHRVGDLLLLDHFKSWSPDLGHEVHQAWLDDLTRACSERGLEVRYVTPRKGDVLIWHADLVHGGAGEGSRSAARHSAVAHYCPASTVPLYVTMPAERRAPFGDAWYSSDHHDAVNA